MHYKKLLEGQLRQAQKLEAMALLASGVAHDFNNLLTGILGYGQLAIKRLEFNHPCHRMIENVVDIALQGRHSTNQLLQFTRQQAVEYAYLDPREAIKQSKDLLEHLIGEDINLQINSAPALKSIYGDKGQLAQVILNLALNARDAMPDGGTLTIGAVNKDLRVGSECHRSGLPSGEYVVLTVQDTGCGIDDQTKEHMFEPFFTTKPRGKGTGLGLSTVYGIVRQFKGQIFVNSILGVGTTFEIYFPAGSEIGFLPERRSYVEELSTMGATILLVEDNDHVRSATAEQLADAGYTVLTAPNGMEACKLFGDGQTKINLLITDLIMPSMSGADLANALSDLYPGLRVLFTSGYFDDSVKAQMLKFSDAQILRKPFLETELIAKVREVLHQKAKARHAS